MLKYTKKNSRVSRQIPADPDIAIPPPCFLLPTKTLTGCGYDGAIRQSTGRDSRFNPPRRMVFPKSGEGPAALARVPKKPVPCGFAKRVAISFPLRQPVNFTLFIFPTTDGK
jgi:hypothetical protein